MSLKVRQIICLFFYLIFFLVTPLIVAYTAGYKFNFSKRCFQKTGMLILDSQPPNSKIFINNKIQQNLILEKFFNKPSYITTPAKIKNLLPGEYTIKLELDGYWPWEKKLKINQSASTYAKDIFLFKKNLPTLVATTKIDNLQLSPSKEKLTMLSDNQLALFNLVDGTEQTTQLLIKKQFLSWSADSKKIILADSIYDADNLNNKITIEDLTIKNAEKLFWDNNKLYYQSANSLNCFNIYEKNNKKIIDNQKIDNYLIKNNYFYILSNLKSNSTLNIFKIDTAELISSINLPGPSDYSFIDIKQKTINLFDQNHQTIYLIDQSVFSRLPAIKKINNIKYTFWINDSKLLFANDFEIWLYDLKSEEKTLITRISDNITGVVWYPSNNYIIYSTNNSINAIEMDEREKRNVIELVKYDKIFSLFINPKGAVVYFSAKINNQEGLYEYSL
ncbi:MAG: hypothetical protein AAB653_01895 [Patescibacteria group bacterium]